MNAELGVVIVTLNMYVPIYFFSYITYIFPAINSIFYFSERTSFSYFKFSTSV